MTERATTSCPNCEALEGELQKLKEHIAALEADLAKAKKNSDNSSKPPSSDIVKPPKGKGAGKKTKGKRKRGGQPGHPRHQREPFEESEIDHFFDYFYQACPDCGGEVTLNYENPRIVQQVEIPPNPITISEHRGLGCWCEHCQKMHFAPIHEDIRQAGLVGPRLTALVAYLKGACHCSFSTIRKFFRDVLQVKISRGQLRKVCAKVSDSLDVSYEELMRLLPYEAVVNVDETGHKDNGQRMWTWCFRTSLYTLFKIDPSRSSQVLIDVLGSEFNGVLGCDYFSAYRKYMGDFNVLVQFCLAHFIRDVKFLVEHPNSKNRAYGRRVLGAVRALFHVIHRREKMGAERFTRKLKEAGDELCRQATYRVPSVKEAQNLQRRFEKHGDSYIRFITTPGIDPTNNVAEQAIRFVVIDRHVTQGSRSEAGQRWLERIWTAIATCAQQGRSVFEFLFQSVTAHFSGSQPPSLVPDTS
jgi:transposase